MHVECQNLIVYNAQYTRKRRILCLKQSIVVHTCTLVLCAMGHMMFSVSEHIYTVRATSTHRGNMRLVFIEGDQSGNQQAQMSNLNMSLFVLSFLHG